MYKLLRMLQCFALFTLLSLLGRIAASPTSFPVEETGALQRRATDPVFPDSPPSCPICQQGYPNIQGCAQAAPVLANFSMIIFNPGAFIDVIKCACADTFQSVFPQCVDCVAYKFTIHLVLKSFIQTNQTDVLDTSDLPGIVGDIRRICALSSTLLGNVSGADASLTATTNAPVPTSTGTGAALRTADNTLSLRATAMYFALALVMACVGL
ncbi:hypothetical protein D9613_003908 [Agrocybe pediades]|uniref:Uncharacterized protein n=1 Tax=Agrocybe pediades TaxID=84607 RepID=A0A8H4VKW1_9AGAR|nr:hypothetical protein D9613_003908 [Agrocybe pediades]